MYETWQRNVPKRHALCYQKLNSSACSDVCYPLFLLYARCSVLPWAGGEWLAICRLCHVLFMRSYNAPINQVPSSTVRRCSVIKSRTTQNWLLASTPAEACCHHHHGHSRRRSKVSILNNILAGRMWSVVRERPRVQTPMSYSACCNWNQCRFVNRSTLSDERRSIFMRCGWRDFDSDSELTRQPSLAKPRTMARGME